MSDVTLIGPVGVREFRLDRACDAHEGHEHNYDHATIVISGRVKVEYRYTKDGAVVEGESREFGPGGAIAVKADVRHTIRALEPGTRYLCVFSHRDFDGLVTQSYAGNPRAYA